jgi:hypothetical protein
MRKLVLIALLVLLCLPRHAVGQDKSWPAVTNYGDPADLGRGIQRTMTLLSSSNAKHRPTVRILLYGQSITAGPWGVMLEEHLRETYPHANLVYERKPLSGFSTDRLVKTAEADLYPSYPDLVIFHDYGNNDDYETMIRKLREQTTAEVIIQGDHLRRSEKPIDEADPNRIEDRRQRWAASRNYQFLPHLAQRYGCGFDARRDLWKAYLREHKLQPGELLKDDVHPNDHGSYVMAELIKAQFTKRDTAKIDPMNCGYVRTYTVGEDISAAAESLRFAFEGNRIDVVLNNDARGTCQVMLDGHRPLDDPAMLYHGRNRVKWRDTSIPPGPWPAVLKMSFQQPLLQERWTLKATQDPANSEVYTFIVHGSETGDDGSGRTDRKFVSDSGRVVIEPADWDIEFAIVALRRLQKLPTEFQLDWNVESQAVNQVGPLQPDAPGERVVTVAQRMPDGQHTIELSGDVTDVKALQVYTPAKFPCPANDTK